MKVEYPCWYDERHTCTTFIYRRLGRPDHHGQRRSRPGPPLARETGRGRAGGPVRQPHRATRHCDRGPQSPLVRTQYRANSRIVQHRVSIRYSGGWRRPWMASWTGSGAVFEAKFMLPWSFSEEAAAEKYMAQLQHNMWVTNARAAVLSVITGGGKWVEITIPMDPLYSAPSCDRRRRSSGAASRSGEPPHLFDVEPPRPRIEAIRIVDMSSSNSWAEFAGAVPQHPRGLSRP